MPTGYAGEGKTYSKSQGKWITKSKTASFEYEYLDQKSASLMVSFFRWYPDYFADLCRSENARYTLELPQRLMLRIDARFKDNYITGCRGLTKTYIKLLGKMIKGILYPGEIMRYNAPNQKQAAALATQAFHQIEKDYPIIASHWAVRNDRSDMFRITTNYGSEFTMYAPRGDNCSETIAEEIGQEGEEHFDIEKYEKDVLPTCRIDRRVNQQIDHTHINLQHSHISNACSKQNRAYTIHRANVMKEMLYGEKYEGLVIDISWISALLGNIRDINYIKDMKSTLTATDWLREMCARYTGTEDSPLIPDDVLSRSKKLSVMESRHCGDHEAIYVVSHDVSYVDDKKNAKCADIVLKLTPYKETIKRDKYRKQVVYAETYPPPKTAYLQAQRVKAVWEKYCHNGGNATYLVIDTWQYGTEIVEELMKPSADGSPTLCCVDHMAFNEIEQPNSLPVIYPMKAGSRGTLNEDGEMIKYAQIEFDQGNVELLISNILDGVEAYKNAHNIKDNKADRVISIPYDQTELLCQQIANLRTKVSGLTYKEERKSKAIQRDLWSALKYALRMAQILEGDLKRDKYKAKSSWSSTIEEFQNGATVSQLPSYGNARANVIGLRKWR